LRLSRVTVVAVCVLALVASAAAACGGGSSGTKKVDTSKVPTATLPATLPEPKLVGSGAVQSGGATSYTVKSGDTLAGIAARFGVSLEDLRAANPNIDGSTLSIGQSVKLPVATDAPPAAATEVPTKAAAATQAATAAATQAATATEAAPVDTPVPAATATPASVGQSYTVVEGDIPVAIAQKFGITVEELLAANPGLDPTGLKIGQVLIIPPKRP
jgi:LysM repeat protein